MHATIPNVAEESTSLRVQTPTGVHAPTRVLLVEDDMALADALGYRLAARGFSVTATHDGLSALDLVWAMQHDVILTDLMLPRLSGLRLMLALNADPERLPPPVVVLTAADESEAYRAHCRGARAVIKKPARIDHLASVLDQAARRN